MKERQTTFRFHEEAREQAIQDIFSRKHDEISKRIPGVVIALHFPSPLQKMRIVTTIEGAGAHDKIRTLLMQWKIDENETLQETDFIIETAPFLHIAAVPGAA